MTWDPSLDGPGRDPPEVSGKLVFPELEISVFGAQTQRH
jgi:hypothetical protein